MAALAASVACRETPPVRFDFTAAARARVAGTPGASGGFEFRGPPRLARVAIDGEIRPAVLTSAEGFDWRGRVAPGARLHVGAQVPPELWSGLESAEILVRAESDDGSRVEVLGVSRSTRGDSARRWLDLDADMSRWPGAPLRLRFEARLRWVGDPPPEAAAAAVAWSPITVQEPAPRREAPNVLVVLIDTLRADHVGAYGYARPTTPEIDRRLAARGLLFERAYAQAPWTLPSVASLFVGVEPGRFLGGAMASFALPAGPEAPETLPELFAARGYATGGFIANPTLHAGNGFARGFETFYNPPLDLESMKRHADDLTPRLQAWLRAHQRRPFFLYAHYLDPHDPYIAPDLVAGRSAFLPDYDGTVTGDWVHGIYNGRLRLPDPPRDLEQIVALYDSEVRYVDEHVGRLLETLEPETLANTIVVLTADHGEELFDHGGWKHGHSLYEEQIRVPLIVRWDGRVEPGKRQSEPVSLLDVLPTLAAAAGIERREHWRGVDLLAPRGGAAGARRTIFAQHLSSGPLRAAVVSDRHKLILFNRTEAPVETDYLSQYLWRLDLGRFAGVESYDLAADPGERVNLEGGQGGADAAALATVLHQELDRHLGGLRVVAAGLEAGVKASVTIRFVSPLGTAERVVPYFLSSEDRLEPRSGSLLLRLTGDGSVKGAVVEGALEGGVFVEWSGLPRLWVGDGTPARPGQPISAAALRASRWPPVGGQPGFYLWTSATPAGAWQRRTEDAETLARLRALGYVE